MIKNINDLFDNNKINFYFVLFKLFKIGYLYINFFLYFLFNQSDFYKDYLSKHN